MNHLIHFSLVFSFPLALLAVPDFQSEARALIEKKEWPSVVSLAQKELSIRPDSVDGLLAIGIAERNLGQLQEAQIHIDRAKRMILKDMDSIYTQALTTSGEGNRKEFLLALTKLGSMESSDVWRMGPTGSNTPAPNHVLRFTKEPMVSKVFSTPDPIDIDFSKVKILFQAKAPAYPAIAKIKRISGTVILHVVVDPSGIPTEALAVDGPEELKKTAESYCLLWRFKAPDSIPADKPFRFKLTMPFRLR